MKVITMDMLVLNDACREQRELFQATFGESAELTRENWDKAIEAGLDVEWVSNLLPEHESFTYTSLRVRARDTYHRATRPALDAWCYAKENDARYEEYRRISNLATEEYYKTCYDALFEALLRCIPDS